jgi:hypothetical protein
VYNRVLDLAELDAVRLSNLAAQIALTGDYNDNDAVDSADYVRWRDSLGMSISLPNEGTTPGMVTSEDYTVWRANFGKTAVPGLARLNSVPEPDVVALGAVGLLMLVIAAAPRRLASK